MDNETQRDLDPIMDVFAGADGGIAFAKLSKGFLPAIYNKANRTPAEEALVKMVKQFSRLCQAALDGKL